MVPLQPSAAQPIEARPFLSELNNMQLELDTAILLRWQAGQGAGMQQQLHIVQPFQPIHSWACTSRFADSCWSWRYELLGHWTICWAIWAAAS